QRWAVSFEVFTPWNTDLNLGSHNGGINISDVRGRIEFESHNGGVQLSRVSGDVKGETHNGGVQIEVDGTSWQGRQLEVASHNGSIALTVPATFNASVETHTN